MIYLLLLNVSLALCYLLYRIFFRKLTFFQWNRFYLLGSVVFSLLIPIGLFIDLSSYYVMEEGLPTVYLDDVLYGEPLVIYSTERPYFLLDILQPLYWFGVVMMLLWMLLRVYKITRSIRTVDGFHSFSFFSWIVLGHRVKAHQVIMDHERVHVEQGHSYDVLLIELLRIFNWFNPVLYWYQRELKFQHECIADELCAADKVAYAELLVAHAMRTDVPLVHAFSNHSFLKKRIMMLFKNKSTSKHKYCYLAVLPAMGIIVLSTLVFNTSKAKALVVEIQDQILDVALPVEDVKLAFTAEPLLVEVSTAPQPAVSAQDSIRKEQGESGANVKVNDTIYMSVEVHAEPEMGYDKFREWVTRHYKAPQEIIDKDLRGVIEVVFNVKKDGTLSDFKIVKDLDYGAGDALIAVLKKSPKWLPAIKEGMPVEKRISWQMPVNSRVWIINVSAPDSLKNAQDPKVVAVTGRPTFRGTVQPIKSDVSAKKTAHVIEVKGYVKGHQTQIIYDRPVLEVEAMPRDTSTRK